MLILDTTVLLAAIDGSRSSHRAAREIFSTGRMLAVSTQTIREALAVSTRSVSANGLGMPFPAAWTAITAMRMACGRMLYEDEKWWNSFAALSQQVQPAGRALYDLGQIAHALRLGPPAQLLTDDRGLASRYGSLISIVSVGDL